MAHVWIPKAMTLWDVLRALEDSGAKRGRVKGAYVAGDLSELTKTILLCPACKHGFDWRKHHYYNVTHYDKIHATGKCDVCKEMSTSLSFYLHETVLRRSWTPRQELRAQRRGGTFV